MDNATYAVELRIDGTLIGDVRHLAQDLVWARRRTKTGVDEISFTINDVLFEKWCQERGTSVRDILKPLALDCQVVRNGVPVVGGFLATMPAYSPNAASANLQMQFDGYLNYLAGVYIHPIGTLTQNADAMISAQIQMADSRALAAGKAFGFTEGTLNLATSIQQTFDNYISVKDFITNRSDNVTGAGPFDVFFHPDRTYDIIGEANFGDKITDYTIYYPMRLNNVTATSISAGEVDGFASTVIGIGSGEISSDPTKNTAITYTETNSEAVADYGYYETIDQNSSVSQADTLQRNVKAALNQSSNILWQPEIELTGRQVAPTPNGTSKIWLGDIVSIVNNSDMTGTMNGQFRVNELSVAVSAQGAETITPTLERYTDE